MKGSFRLGLGCFGLRGLFRSVPVPDVILSSIERPDSPFVRIQYADATGQVRRVKTAIRKSDPDKVRRVALALNQVEAQLLNKGAKADGGGWTWVPGWMETRYATRPPTLRQYQIRWKWLALFLRLRRLHDPAAVAREDCFAYVPWRQSGVKEKSGRAPGVNTAVSELKLLAMILDEAEARGLVPKNVARRLRIERAQVALKPEMSDDEIRTVFHALKTRPGWMHTSFFTALQTGLRFSETAIRRAQVRLDRGEVSIDAPKGGTRRAFTIQIYPEIEPMLRAFMASREPALWSLPAKERDFASLVWVKFFRELGLGHLCFHCTRVTFITRGARAGVPESAMMKMVNHASKEVHRIYQRLADADALGHRARFAIPTGGGATVGSPRGRSARGKSGSPPRGR